VPDNLQEATGNVNGRHGEIEYWIGNAYQALGDSAKASSAWNDATGMAAAGAGGPGANGRCAAGRTSAGWLRECARSRPRPTIRRWRWRSWASPERAMAIFTQLIATGSKSLGSAPEMKGPAQAVATSGPARAGRDAHYLAGLGQLGLNHPDQARQEFSLALEASPDHYAAMRALNDMTR